MIWPTLPISDFAILNSGYAFKSSTWETAGIPVIKITNVKDGEVRLAGCGFVSRENVIGLERYRLSENDLLITMTGDVGDIGVVRSNLAGSYLNQRVGRFKIYDNRLDENFLRFCLQMSNVRERFRAVAYGAAQPNISSALILAQEIPFPPLPTQRKIAAVLSAYDDLIENNTRRVRVLEEMARALYREWFVEYRFPGHETAEFVEDEQGRRPAGWERVKFTDIAFVMSGGTPKTTEATYWNGNIPFYTPKDSPDGFYVTKTDKSVTELGLEKCNSRLYPKDTVFITARGTVGNLALASGDMAMNQSCYALDSRSELGQHYLFILTEQLVSGFKKQATGAVFDAITVSTFQQTLILKPGRDLLDDFARQIAPIFEASLSMTQRNANLRQTRDLLLPRLVSGELDVSALDIRGPGLGAQGGAGETGEAVA